MRLETNISAQRDSGMPSDVGTFGAQLKWVAARLTLFALAVFVGWAFAWLVQTAYNSYEPLKTMLAPIGRYLQNLGEIVNLLFR